MFSSQAQLKVLRRDFDWHILIIVLLLLLFGLCFLWSASQYMGGFASGLQAQIIRVGISLPFFLLGLAIKPRWLRRNAYVLYAISILLLIGLFFFGREINNAKRWFSIGGSFSIQPSEFVKLGLIFALAKLVMYGRKLQRFEGLILPMALLACPLVLIAKQPDLGTALILIPITLAILFAAGARRRHLLLIVLAGLILAPIGYLFLKPYQRTRIATWLEQGNLTVAQRQNEAYHIWQGKLSVGSGGFWGNGLGQGPLNQLDYLPERHNDYIVGLIGEEGGFLASFALLVMYFILVALIYSVALKLREPFGRLVVVGIGTMFLTHFFVNVGVVTALLPPTGLTLPFVSFGGSSLLSAFLALGLVLNLGARQEAEFGSDGFDT